MQIGRIADAMTQKPPDNSARLSLGPRIWNNVLEFLYVLLTSKW